jgi:predicted acyl esterase
MRSCTWDVRGTGRSGGEYRFFDEAEQRDLYDAIEWIATQPWSDGNVGGIGQSYYAVMQWFMAIQTPPHLKCIAPYDGLIDVYAKLYDQAPQSPDHRMKDIQPASRVVTKGWLRASHRAVDPKLSTEYAPWYTHADPQPLEPGTVTKIEVAVMPTAYRFKKGNRIRIDLANGDSVLTELGWFHHEYTPDKRGQDTIFHSARFPSQILLPIVR